MNQSDLVANKRNAMDELRVYYSTRIRYMLHDMERSVNKMMIDWVDTVKDIVKSKFKDRHYNLYGGEDDTNNKTRNNSIKEYLYREWCNHKNRIVNLLIDEQETIGEKKFVDLWDDAQRRIILKDFR